MTLIELCEPLFQYICRLNRMSRAAGQADYGVARAEVKALLEDLVQKASTDMRLSGQMRKMELPLIFFVDSMIAESKLRFANQWHQKRLAYERNELAGDEKFFDLLDETMKDSSEEASERLVVYYTCIGLGFTGMYAGQPEFLRKTMMTIAPRIRHLMDADQTSRVCPEAYEGVDSRDLVQPPSGKMLVVALVFLVCAVSVVVAYIFMFKQASSNFAGALNQIVGVGSTESK